MRPRWPRPTDRRRRRRRQPRVSRRRAVVRTTLYYYNILQHVGPWKTRYTLIYIRNLMLCMYKSCIFSVFKNPINDPNTWSTKGSTLTPSEKIRFEGRENLGFFSDQRFDWRFEHLIIYYIHEHFRLYTP